MVYNKQHNSNLDKYAGLHRDEPDIEESEAQDTEQSEKVGWQSYVESEKEKEKSEKVNERILSLQRAKEEEREQMPTVKIEEEEEERKGLGRIEKNAKAILKFKHPTDNELELAFDHKPQLASEYPILSEAIQRFLVERDPENIKYIAKPTRAIEGYVGYRGLTDYKDAQYYWKLANKIPHSQFAKLQVHPFVGFSWRLFIWVPISWIKGIKQKEEEKKKKPEEAEAISPSVDDNKKHHSNLDKYAGFPGYE